MTWTSSERTLSVPVEWSREVPNLSWPNGRWYVAVPAGREGDGPVAGLGEEETSGLVDAGKSVGGARC